MADKEGIRKKQLSKEIMNTTRDFAAERKAIQAQLETDLNNRSSDEEVEAITQKFYAEMGALDFEEAEAHEAGKRKIYTAAEAEALIKWDLADVDLEALTAGGKNLWDIKYKVLSMVEEANGIGLLEEAYLYFAQNFPNQYGDYAVITVDEDDLVLEADETLFGATMFVTHAILMWMGSEEA